MNAKNELIEILNQTPPIKCAIISCNGLRAILPLNHTTLQLEDFYKSLDFEYYRGYGMQELYGTVWLDDGTWLSRGEYDGAEWWEHNILPEIPIECLI